MKIRSLLAGAALLILAACQNADKVTDTADNSVKIKNAETAQNKVKDKTPVKAQDDEAKRKAANAAARKALNEILAAQPKEVKARFKYRHPAQTLNFFRIKPGMTVVEVLPGGGWYSKILMPYLGPEGELVAVDYNKDLWPNFGFVDADFLEKRKTWAETWIAGAQAWEIENGSNLNAFKFGEMPADLTGTADAVLFIRALHNLNRFDPAFLEQAINDAKTALKPNGLVGIVQHRAPEGNTDEWASGAAGYLKQSYVIAKMEEAGFKLLKASEINANPNDKLGADDVVWRLPPSLATSREDAELKAQMEAIGESDRMTLLFRKTK